MLNQDCQTSYTAHFRLPLEEVKKRFISKKLQDELDKGYISRAVKTPYCSHNVFCVPKSSGEGYRCVVDCSRPYNLSVTNYVEKVSRTFSYKGIDNLIDQIVTYDYIAIVDIKDTYRAVSIHPLDRKKTGYIVGFGGGVTDIDRQSHLYGIIFESVYFCNIF